jgi:uncharacterized membrane protein (DUF2068 family)
VNVGVLISIINTLVLIAVFPGALPTGPLYNLAAILGMLLGIGMIKIFVERHSPKNEAFVAALLTISGAVVRALLMALINWALLRFPPPVGYASFQIINHYGGWCKEVWVYFVKVIFASLKISMKGLP